MILSWGKLFAMLIAIHLPTAAWANLTGIKYFMATCGGQNCDSVCTTFGLKCASTGQSFPRFSALEIFESLGITCKTNNYTDIYQYEDQPNYMADSPGGSEDWIGMCIGFKSIPSTIDCHTANNSYVRRLCPCYDPLATQPPTVRTLTTKEITTTSSQNLTTAAETEMTYATTREHSTKNNAAQPQKQFGGTNETERTALIVVAIFAAGLMLCVLRMAFLFLWNRRQLSRGKTGVESDNEKLHVQYHKNINEVGVPDMMDGLAVEIEAEEDNSCCEMRSADLTLHDACPGNMDVKNSAKEPSCYEDMSGKSTDNVLYASVPEETNTAFSAEQSMPVYDRLV